MSGTRRRQLTWYTRPDCGLCEAAWPHLARAAGVLRVAVRQVDISADPDLQTRYGTRIPVLARDGEVLAEGALSATDVWRVALQVRFRG